MGNSLGSVVRYCTGTAEKLLWAGFPKGMVSVFVYPQILDGMRNYRPRISELRCRDRPPIQVTAEFAARVAIAYWCAELRSSKETNEALLDAVTLAEKEFRTI